MDGDRVTGRARAARGQGVVRGACVRWVAAGALLAWAPQVGGQAPAEAPRLLLVGPIDADLLGRIEGQTADLTWVIDSQPAAGAEARDASAQPARALATARRLAGTRAARLTMWVTDDGADGALTLWTHDSRTDDAIAREFPRPSDDSRGRSAQHEALALAVRASLQSTARDDAMLARSTGDAGAEANGRGPVGALASDAADSRAQTADGNTRKTTTTSDTDTDAGNDPAGSGRDATRWRIGVGWFATLDGQSEPAQHGLRAVIAVQPPASPLELQLRAGAGLGASAGDTQTRVTLVRNTALLGVATALGERSGPQLSGALAAGVSHLRRATEAAGSGLEPTADAAAIDLALELALEARLPLASWHSGVLALEAGVGALWLPRRTRLRYTRAGEVVELPLWRVAPGAHLGVSLQWD